MFIFRNAFFRPPLLLIRFLLVTDILFLSQAFCETFIKIKLSERNLYLVDSQVEKNDRILNVFPIAIGDESSPTPTGTFEIIRMEDSPIYKSKSGKLFKPGADSPVGSRLMSFHMVDDSEYSIHGTPWPIWVNTRAAVTGGCIRMLNKDIDWIYDRVTMRTRVEITH